MSALKVVARLSWLALAVPAFLLIQVGHEKEKATVSFERPALKVTVSDYYYNWVSLDARLMVRFSEPNIKEQVFFQERHDWRTTHVGYLWTQSNEALVVIACNAYSPPTAVKYDVIRHRVEAVKDLEQVRSEVRNIYRHRTIDCSRTGDPLIWVCCDPSIRVER